jgi:hypothetical protein
MPEYHFVEDKSPPLGTFVISTLFDWNVCKNNIARCVPEAN